MALNPVDLIARKRDGKELSTAELDWLVNNYLAGQVAEEQFAAFLMAVYFRGMSHAELTAWTNAMINSGSRMSFSGLSGPTADKHSTGGVGDKISLILGPLAAACGLKVPMISGRGLAHTGGTLDKLEAIPGFQVDLSASALNQQLQDVGVAICAAGQSLAPADRRIYALRDITATVDSIPLIASSIMSKKIAEGTDSLVLDVKTGNGAFMAELDRAKELAQTMVALGKSAGVQTSALITDMSSPLGKTVGNANEVAEAIQVLQGHGPQDIIDLSIALVTEMLRLAGLDADPANELANGNAFSVWQSMVRAQGGDPDAELTMSDVTADYLAEDSGYLQQMNSLAIGRASWLLGAGRSEPGAAVDHGAGIDLLHTVGDYVSRGEPILRMYSSATDRIDQARAELESAITFSSTPATRPQLIIEQIS